MWGLGYGAVFCFVKNPATCPARFARARFFHKKNSVGEGLGRGLSFMPLFDKHLASCLLAVFYGKKARVKGLGREGV